MSAVKGRQKEINQSGQDPGEITLDKTNRIIKPNPTKPCPIIAKFHSYKTQELVQ